MIAEIQRFGKLNELQIAAVLSMRTTHGRLSVLTRVLPIRYRTKMTLGNGIKVEG